MATTFYVAFDKPVPPYGTRGGECPALAAEHAALDRLANAHGLPTLDRFVGMAPAAPATATGEDPADRGRPLPRWYDPAAGRTAVQALAQFLRDNPAAISRSAAMLAELEQVERELAAAEQCQAKFHVRLLD